MSLMRLLLLIKSKTIYWRSFNFTLNCKALNQETLFKFYSARFDLGLINLKRKSLGRLYNLNPKTLKTQWHREELCKVSNRFEACLSRSSVVYPGYWFDSLLLWPWLRRLDRRAFRASPDLVIWGAIKPPEHSWDCNWLWEIGLRFK